MNIVLVFPPFYYEPLYNLPPLGLVNLATSIKGRNRRITLIDFVLAIRQKALKMGPGIYDDCVERILTESPDVVGFSAQCTTYPAIVRVCQKIKQIAPNIKIVLGGHNATFVDQETLYRFPYVDAIVRGEGEITFGELIGAYEAGSDETDIAGVTYRRGDHIIRNRERELISNLDDLSLPDYNFLPPLSEYRDACQIPRRIAILEVGRGCPHQCVYCSESIMWRRATRTLSVPRLVEEMETLHRDFGADCFTLAYDQFTAKRKFVESFCRMVIDKGLNHIPWYCISRLDSVDRELLALMKEAGCESMCYGIDSGSKRTLAFIRKKIDKDLLYLRVSDTSEQGLIPTLSFVVGFPEEEKEDIDETLFLALQTGILGNNNPLIQMPTVLPGTDLFRRYSDKLVRRQDTYFAMGLEFDRGKRLKEDEDLIDSDPRIFSSFYNVPCAGRSLEDLNLIATYFPLVVRFYPRTFLLLALEMEVSVSDLFLQWLTWLAGKTGRAELTLSPQECYLFFKEFVLEVLQKKARVIRSHLKDILDYELASIGAAEFTAHEEPFHIDIKNIWKLRPLRSRGIFIKEFDFDLSVIILDLKAGQFKPIYPLQKTWLLFRQEGSILQVTEINGFTKDFLYSCNGENTLESICRDLYSVHGPSTEFSGFKEGCADAARVLAEGGFLINV